MGEVIDLAPHYGVNTVAVPLLTGGRRLSSPDAFLAMSDACERAALAGKRMSLKIYVLDRKEFEAIQNLAGGMGWR